MILRWEPMLIEEAVFLYARADEGRFRQYRRRIDPLYDAPERDRAMAEAHLELFRSFGLAAPVEEALRSVTGVERALLARAQRPGDEGAELLVGEDRTLLLRLAPEGFGDAAALRRLLRHEMRHILDMLDPAFGYEPDLGVRGRTKAQENLVRDRYRVLWNLAIDAIEEPPVSAEVRRRQMEHAFRALEADPRRLLGERFRDPSRRRHAELAAAARDPWVYLGLPRASGPSPGHPCPLCGFPTHQWATDLPEEGIRADYPRWQPEEGACLQCAEIYRVLGAPGR